MFGLNTYLKRKKLEIDIEMNNYRVEMIEAVQQLALTCAIQKGEYEHEFHSKREELKIAIAKIEVSKDLMTKEVDSLKFIIFEKDNEIERLNNICLELAKSKTIIQH